MSIMTHRHPRQHHHPHVYQYLVIALAVVIVIVGTLLIVPLANVTNTALIPVTGNQNAYAEYLRGEKFIYAAPLGLDDAIAAYHLGEKNVSPRTIDSSEALTAYHFGEQHVISALDAAMFIYRLGEKDY